jgi:putative toxin-antitoxin system antitoxin component (TIGR02293 family)
MKIFVTFMENFQEVETGAITLLGGKKILGNVGNLEELAEVGLPKKALVFFLHESHLDEKRLFRYLDVTKRTLDNYRPEERMRLYISDRLIHLAELFAKGKELFNSLEFFTEWLNQPSVDLQGEKPIEQIHTRKGIDELLTILGRLEHGVLA